MSTYIPINCSYYDELEAIATLRKTVCIQYKDEAGAELQVEAKITNLYSKDKEEFMVLDNGLEFRLDRLVSADGKPVPRENYC